MTAKKSETFGLYGATDGLLDGLQELWTDPLGDPQVCIAILDGPVDTRHPSLVNAAITPVDTVLRSTCRDGVACSHGTYIASLIFGQPNRAVQGVAPRCRGLIVPIYADCRRDSLAPCSQLDLARAIRQGAGRRQCHKHKWGSTFALRKRVSTLAEAVRACGDLNVLIVASAIQQAAISRRQVSHHRPPRHSHRPQSRP